MLATRKVCFQEWNDSFLLPFRVVAALLPKDHHKFCPAFYYGSVEPGCCQSGNDVFTEVLSPLGFSDLLVVRSRLLSIALPVPIVFRSIEESMDLRSEV